MLSTVVQAAHPPPAAWTPETPVSTNYGSAPTQPTPQQEIREPQLLPLERYDRSPGECRSFLTQCQLIFSLQPRTFPMEAARVAFITQLTGRAKKWGTTAWSADSPCVQSSACLMQDMHQVFDWLAVGLEASRELMQLRQEDNSVSDYTIYFQTLVIDSGWEGRALIDAFFNGLSEAVKDKLLTQEPPDELDRIIVMAIRIGSRLEDRKHLVKPRSPPKQYSYCRQPNPPLSRQQVPNPPSPSKDSVGEPEAMMVDQSRWVKRRACLYCGGRGHYTQNCPVKGNAH